MDTSPDNSTLMTFPCDFHLKVIGVASPNFVTDIASIVTRHFPEVTSVPQCNASTNGAYVALTFTLYVMTQASLDALYQELVHHAGVKMVL